MSDGAIIHRVAVVFQCHTLAQLQTVTPNEGQLGIVSDSSTAYVYSSHLGGWTAVGGAGGVTLPIAESDVTNLVSDLAGKAALVHTHIIADVTSLQSTLDGKAPIVHTHAESDVTNLVSDLAAKEATANKGIANGYAGLDAGALVPLAQLPSAALTRVSDTNVTLTLGGTPASALLVAASLTLGWSGQLGVSRGGTALSTIASGSILGANALDTLSAITSTSGLKALQNSGGVISWNTSTGTGDSVFATAPTFVTSILAPIVYGSAASSGNLLLQSTSNSTRGTVQTADLVQLATSAQAFSGAGIYLDIGTAAATISSAGSITALRYAATATFTSNGAAGGAVALFNAQFTAKDDGTARTLAESIILSSNATYTATVAGGLTLSDVAGIPAYTTIYHAPTFTRTGAGTGTATSVAGLYLSALGNVAVGFTVTNWIGVLIDKPTVGGTLTNFYGIKNNGAAATGYWFLYETGGMQSSHKGNLRLGSNTAPNTVLDVTGVIRTDQNIANGTVATVLGSVGPVGSNTTVQEWFKININGTTRYVPCF